MRNAKTLCTAVVDSTNCRLEHKLLSRNNWKIPTRSSNLLHGGAVKIFVKSDSANYCKEMLTSIDIIESCLGLFIAQYTFFRPGDSTTLTLFATTASPFNLTSHTSCQVKTKKDWQGSIMIGWDSLFVQMGALFAWKWRLNNDLLKTDSILTMRHKEVLVIDWTISPDTVAQLYAVASFSLASMSQHQLKKMRNSRTSESALRLLKHREFNAFTAVFVAQNIFRVLTIVQRDKRSSSSLSRRSAFASFAKH